MEFKKELEAIQQGFADFKELHKKELEEIKKNGVASAETVAQVTKANSAIDVLRDELKAATLAFNRSGGAGGGKDATPEMIARKEAFNKYCRKGEAGLTEVEKKALSSGSDPDGGYLVLPEMSAEVVKKIFESSPIRPLASVQTISSNELKIIEDLDEAASGWTSEQGTRSTTSTPQLKEIKIVAEELYAKPKATQTVLDDAMWNLESWLAEKVAEKFGRDEASAFVAGNGVGKPKGFLSYDSGTSFGQIEQVVSGDAALLKADGLIDLVGSLKAPYKKNASFLMKRTTVTAVRKLKDSQNRYLWEPGLNGASQDMLLGYPLFEADDMQAVAANALAVAFGDFKAGYQIVDRFGIRTLRDPYSAKPYIEFYTTKRVGGGVKNFEAIKIQKIST